MGRRALGFGLRAGSRSRIDRVLNFITNAIFGLDLVRLSSIPSRWLDLVESRIAGSGTHFGIRFVAVIMGL